jgi:succinyl-CoA synthetase alpha subunit
MSILIDEKTRVICQGITGRLGTLYTSLAIKYGTKMIGGTSPGKSGIMHSDFNLPVFNTIFELKRELGKVDATVIYVPAPYAPDAIMEAIDAQIPLICCITEGNAMIDMLKVKRYLKDSSSILIGPNCPGITSPGKSMIGIIPSYVCSKGNIGVISRSGTLTFEAADQLTKVGLGQSTLVGIGGDPLIGLTFKQVAERFVNDPDTHGLVLIGEIGGTMEEDVANFLHNSKRKLPTVGLIAGIHAPVGKRMGHAGAIVSGKNSMETAESKVKALKAAGIRIIDSPLHIGKTMLDMLNKNSM